MACWSAENATNAYLRTVKMGKRENEPTVAEFISEFTAGRNARFIVTVCANAADSITLAIVSAAHQTGGTVTCILCGMEELQLSTETLGENAVHVKFVTGDAQTLLTSEYREADCIFVDCSLENCERILKTVKGLGRNTMVLGYNAYSMELRLGHEFDAYMLPIGEGLLVSRVAKNGNGERYRCLSGKRSRWVVKVDECTGELAELNNNVQFAVNFPRFKGLTA